MNTQLLLNGLALGFSIAAPVGPIGALCIRRSLLGGLRLGLISGLGAATADALYALIGGFGLTAVTHWLVGERVWLNIVGGSFLIYLGCRTFIARPQKGGSSAGERSATLRGWLQGLSLDPVADTGQPNDHPVIRCDPGGHWLHSGCGRRLRVRGVHRLVALVAAVERRCRASPPIHEPDRAECDQQSLWRRDHRFRTLCAREGNGLKIGMMRYPLRE
jgi:hypothetical protein